MKIPWKVGVEMSAKKSKQLCLSGSGKFMLKNCPNDHCNLSKSHNLRLNDLQVPVRSF